MVAWGEVEPLWRKCFELAWECHLEGSNPIGALVADPEGRVVATGKSAVRAPVSGVVVYHNEIAHAEVNALLALDNRVHDKGCAADYTLYSSLEPCPVCFCAFYMSDVGTLRFAAGDRFGGSTNLVGTTPYLSRKRRMVIGPDASVEEFSIFLNVLHDLKEQPLSDNPVHTAMARDYPRPVALARRQAAEGDSSLLDQREVGSVFDLFQSLLASHG